MTYEELDIINAAHRLRNLANEGGNKTRNTYYYPDSLYAEDQELIIAAYLAEHSKDDNKRY